MIITVPTAEKATISLETVLKFWNHDRIDHAVDVLRLAMASLPSAHEKDPSRLNPALPEAPRSRSR
jgi:hypothetical protein